jgi:hypothetical protein
MSALSSVVVEPGILAPVQLAVLFQFPLAFAFHESLAANVDDATASVRGRKAKVLECLGFM